MTARPLRPPLLAAALFLAAAARAQDPPPDPADPLPKGAKARLGSTRLRDHGGWSAAVLSPDGKFLLNHLAAGRVKYDVTTGRPVGKPTKLPTGLGGSRSDLSADGTRAASAGYAGVTVWEPETGKVLLRLDRRMPFGPAGVSLSADGKTVAVGGSRDDREKDKRLTAVVWDVDKNRQRAEVAVAQNQAAFVALSRDGKTLATWGTHADPNPDRRPADPEPAADPNRAVQFWEAATGKELSRVRTEFMPTAVAFAPDGRSAAVSAGSGLIRLVDPATGAEVRRFFARADHGVRLAFSPDGRTLGSAGYDGTVQLWAVADGRRVGAADCPVGPLAGGPPPELVFTGPDRAVAWAPVGVVAAVWEVPSGKLLSPFAGHAGPVTSVAFRPDGKEVLTGGMDGAVLRWDPAGRPLGEFPLRAPGPLGRMRLYSGAVLFAPDGKTAVADRGGRGVYDLTTGDQLSAPLAGLGTNVLPYLCADGRTVLVVPTLPLPPAPQPKALRVPVWDTATGVRVAEIETPIGGLVAAAVTPDRSKLVTAVLLSRPDSVELTGWELATGKKLGEVSARVSGSVFLAPAPDNRTVVVSGVGSRLAAFDAVAGKVVREFDTGELRVAAAPAFAPDGKSFAAGLGYGDATPATVRVYGWESGQPTHTFHGHAGGATCLAFSPDGKTLASGSFDTTVLLWDLGGGP